MNILVNAVKFKADEKLINYVQEKVSKLAKHSEQIVSCEVNLKIDKPESENNKVVEILINVPGNQLFIKKQADAFEEAVLLAVDAMKPQLEKFKEKI